MAYFTLIILILTSVATTLAFPHPELEVLTQPKPGEEYVFVQTSGSGARPIERKDKHKSEERPFETSHKLPPSLTYALNQADSENTKKQKREAPAPAPAGAIKLDVQKLLEKYKTELKTSTTQAPKSTTKRRNRKTREIETVTSVTPVLTTGKSLPKAVDDDIPLVASGSEKQRSRIQIKKAPNGQEYEYEYVYYYYDDDDDAKVANSHDGPRNQGRGTERTNATPEVNEVVPPRGRTRGKQLGEEEVGEERLPANTRFPPRSRNLNTTPLPEEETKARGRGRGRSTTETAPSVDSVSDETQGSRGRTRANVRRPSLELVDNASFNTHSNSAGAETSASPSFPTDLPAGPVRFLGATPNESVDPPEPIRKPEPEPSKDDSVTERTDDEKTTPISAMDKVALDLYAILQGTQKLSGEDAELSNEENSTANAKDNEELTTLEATTDLVIETTTPTTTTTTTTTTTPAPTTTTTTTTTEAPTGRGRFKGRGRKTTHSSSTTEATHSAESKPKKFNRPSFGGRQRPGARTTTEASPERETASKEESKPATHSRPTLSRSRFGGTRTRTRTTPASAEPQEEAQSSTTASSRPSLPRRSSFNLRTRGRSTTAAPEGESSSDDAAAASSETSTTARTRRVQAGSGVRPLRPGPRINLTRGRPGQTTTTTEPPPEDHVTGDEEQSGNNAEASEEKEPETSTADSSPLGRLRNKHRPNVQVRPKAAASAPVQVRRVNPLLARRRPGQTTEATSEVSQETASTEATVETEENEETEAPAASSTTTTEEPRGLNKLLAGRRRLAARPGAHH